MDCYYWLNELIEEHYYLIIIQLDKYNTNLKSDCNYFITVINEFNVLKKRITKFKNFIKIGNKACKDVIQLYCNKLSEIIYKNNEIYKIILKKYISTEYENEVIKMCKEIEDIYIYLSYFKSY